MAKITTALRWATAALLFLGLATEASAARRRSKGRKPAAATRQVHARSDRALFNNAAAALQSLKKSASRQKKRGEWEAVALKFRQVVDRYPRSPWSDDALLNAGDVYREMGRRFGSKHDRAEAVKAYRWIVNEYPASRLGEPALYAVYEISQASGSNDNATDAAKAYLDAYPRGPRAMALRASLRKRAPEKVERLPDPPPPGTAEVFNQRQWGGDSSVRVVLDVEKSVPIRHSRAADDPNRLVVGLSRARLHPNLQNRAIRRDAGLLREARLVPRGTQDVDLVLQFSALEHYTVFYLQNPLRLVIDAQGPRDRQMASAPAPTVAPTVAEPPPQPTPATATPEPAPARPQVATASPSVPPRGIDSAIEDRAEPAPKAHGEPAVPVEQPKSEAGEETVLTSESQHRPLGQAPSPVPSAPAAASASPPTTAPSSTTAPEAVATIDRRRNPVNLKNAPSPEPTPEPVEQPRSDAGKKPPAPSPSIPPQTNRGGSYSLARQLGLKARRIVIDAGHGGHDPGTIGPGGLQEKDLVLDVALRLQRLLEDDLGVEVIMTRDSDVFVPLEERTAIANAKGADLFLSLHANSSRSRKARGIETYYLNFAGTPHAEAVAARENAVSSGTMKDLQGLVKTIMLNSKIPESRDFASAVQESMVSNVREVSPATGDRGVHTAPFYVLIGATMPSVLAEMAFVSHPEEEKLLKKSAFRDRIAQSLTSGVKNYLVTLPNGPMLTESNPRSGKRSRLQR